MPTVLVKDGFRFFFYSDEGHEPCHIHVKKSDGYAKVWLLPEIKDQYFYGFAPQEIRKIRKIIEENSEILIDQWNEFFNN